MGLNTHSSKVTQNVNYAVSKVDTLLFISVIVAMFACTAAYFIGKRVGILEEKLIWVEQQKLEDREWRLNLVKEFPAVKELLEKRESSVKKELSDVKVLNK